jgi:EAL domain-containing protein (putative c-di-GMP-specific phosphodiesterase class I)
VETAILILALIATVTIVSALAGLGQGFGLTIAAEGIDGPELESALISTGCEEGQGQMFDAAIDAAQVARLFAEPIRLEH